MAKKKPSTNGLVMTRQQKKKPVKVPEMLALLRSHFGTDPSSLPVVEQDFAGYNRANLHLSIADLLPPGEDYQLLEIVPRHEYESINLPKLSRRETSPQYQRGPVEYLDVPLADNRTLGCQAGPIPIS